MSKRRRLVTAGLYCTECPVAPMHSGKYKEQKCTGKDCSPRKHLRASANTQSKKIQIKQEDNNARVGADFSIDKIRSFDLRCDKPEEIATYYRKYQIVHLKNCLSTATTKSKFGLKQVKKLFADSEKSITASFTVETVLQSQDAPGPGSQLDAKEIFGNDGESVDSQWYASFIAQGNENDSSLVEFKRSMPILNLPFSGIDITQTDPVWVFVGKNVVPTTSASNMLKGRLEHTDSVSHDGTWHLQCSGSKWWYLRPAETEEWGEQNLKINASKTSSKDKEFDDNIPRLLVKVETGDIIIVNTRIWWHQTRIPFTGRRGLSISYARDFFSPALALPGRHASASQSDSYTNIDGLYASRRVKRGGVVLTQNELPDCAIPRSTSPSCEVVWLPDETGALVALRDLQVGDWLTVAPSDTEEESSEENSQENYEEESEYEDDSEDGYGPRRVKREPAASKKQRKCN